ncbi:substrate-binding periplasmic protein [Aestuariispira insulae]|uniref:Amino acid ABC transporter substrate-binding protein (PAAT family) n=1 Tax=Aestuariispira insulae TaxID=1461337 RepID=A0A3D9HF11_9PROT|nr:transporter substrate-binding domain-containing protein [Aestuariispira insulae]RED48070.1 amino acid ABC transporter substrate-binding protein (PAAT family) [Aestuariispira insulae]
MRTPSRRRSPRVRAATAEKLTMIQWGTGLLATLMVLALMGLGNAHAETIKLVTGDEYPPYTDKKLEGGGAAVVITEMALKESGMDSTLSWAPWSRAMKDVGAGKQDASFPWGKTPEREADFLFSRNVYSSDPSYGYVLAGSPTINSPDDMKGKTVCLPAGYGEFGHVGTLIASGDLKRRDPKDMAACFKLLERGQVDFVDSAIADAEGAAAEALGDASKVARSEFQTSAAGLHFIVARSHANAQALVDAFDAGFDKLMAAGKIEEVLGRYQ